MKTLILPLKRCYFDAIAAGTKTFEYRLRNDYWKKRLEGRHYDQVVFMMGYPRSSDLTRRITKPYVGYELQTITHPHFGGKPVAVYAIRVAK